MHDRDTGAVGTVNQCRLHLTGLKQYQFNYNLYFMSVCTIKMDANQKKGQTLSFGSKCHLQEMSSKFDFLQTGSLQRFLIQIETKKKT